MVCPINVKAEEAEKMMQKASVGVQDGTYESIDHAVAELKVSKATLHCRLKGESLEQKRRNQFST